MSAVDVERIDDEVARGRRRRDYGPALALAAMLALAASVYLQLAFAVDGRLAGATPDLVLLVLTAIALRWGAVWAATGGFAAGLLLDAGVQGPLGLGALVLVLVGWGMGIIARRGPERSLLTAFAVLAFGIVARGLLDAATQWIILGADLDLTTRVATAAASAVLTLVVAVPCFVAWYLLTRPVDEPSIPGRTFDREATIGMDDATLEVAP